MLTRKVSKNIDGTLHNPYNQNSEYCPLGTALPKGKQEGLNLASYAESNYLESDTRQVSSGKNFIQVNPEELADACGAS
jgi:hypothetical protein